MVFLHGGGFSSGWRPRLVRRRRVRRASAKSSWWRKQSAQCARLPAPAAGSRAGPHPEGCPHGACAYVEPPFMPANAAKRRDAPLPTAPPPGLFAKYAVPEPDSSGRAIGWESGTTHHFTHHYERLPA